MKQVETMTEDEIYAEFIHAGALLKGHFILSSGRHSGVYLQCARLLMDPKRAEKICQSLKIKITQSFNMEFDMIVSPAMGGVIVGYEMGRQLQKPAIFLERVEGKFQLRRGFNIPKKSRCLMVEDVITTGLSSRETMAAIRENGGQTVGACCLVDRSGEQNLNFDVPMVSLLKIDIPTYDADHLPPELKSIPPMKPGSRNIGHTK